MGFPDLGEAAGIKELDGLADNHLALNDWVATRSYIESYSPSQADVVCFKAIDSAPDVTRYPHAARWYKHIAAFEAEFSSLAGDASKSYKDYEPEVVDGAASPPAAYGDEDVDLFGSDEEEDAEGERVREQRLADYKARKAAKPQNIAKSVVILDVKPWDDETDMVALEAAVRGIERHGLVWGTSKLIAVGYGIKKLQLNVVVQDDKVSTQDLQDEIEGFEEYVQSSDITSIGTGYDLLNSIFSPDGRNFQVEYAVKAVENGGTSIGIRCDEGVVLAVEKVVASKLAKAGANKRIGTVDSHVGVVYSGMIPDGRHFIDRARDESQSWRQNFKAPIPTADLASRMGSYLQAYTMYGSVRPFGITGIIGGVDTSEDTPVDGEG
ncbi:hypothetical protein LLEC1_03128, partial [Akanthomyces lecanii]